MLICTNRGCVGTKRKLTGMGDLLGFAFASLTISLRSDLCCDNSFFFVDINLIWYTLLIFFFLLSFFKFKQ